ncbi:MAG: hypothetical protein Q9200_006529 [Gallowayella weberi]
MSDPGDPLNQAFRNHFSTSNSTLGGLLSVLDKPLLHFLRSLLVLQTYGNADLDPIIVEILGSQCGILTRFLQMDSIHLVPSGSVRSFLNKCLDRPICALDLTELQRSTTGAGNDPLRHVDQAIEQNIQANFQIRFAKLAWYRSYKQSVVAQGRAFPASRNNISALLPQMDSIRFQMFTNGIFRNPSYQMRERMYKLVMAGYRYDFLCQDGRMFPNGISNDGHLFLLPDTISAHQWEHDMLEVELQQTREYLRGLGLKRVARSFSGSLNELARGMIDHYMSFIKPEVTTPPFPLATTIPLNGQQHLGKSIAGPSGPFTPSQDRVPSSNRYGPASSKISRMATLQQHLPKLEPDSQQVPEYFQQPNAIRQSTQRQTAINAKRSRSPVPIVPLPILTVASNQAMGRLEIERPLKLPRLMRHSTITPVMSGRDQRYGVSYNQQQQVWQQAPVGSPIQTQQQSQAGTSTFAYGYTPSLDGPTTLWSWPTGYKHSEAILTEKMPSPGSPAPAWSSRAGLKPSDTIYARRQEPVRHMHNTIQEQPDFSLEQEPVQQLQQQQTQQPQFDRQAVQGRSFLKTGPNSSTQTAVWTQAPPPPYGNPEQQQQQQEVCEHISHLHTDQTFPTPKPQQIASAQSASWSQAQPEPTSNVQQQRQQYTHDMQSSQILSIPETEQENQTQHGLCPPRAPPSLENTAQQSCESTPLVQNQSAILIKDITQNGSTSQEAPKLQTRSISTNDTEQQSSPDSIANINQSCSITAPPSEQPTTPAAVLSAPAPYPSFNLAHQAESNSTPQSSNGRVEEIDPPHSVEPIATPQPMKESAKQEIKDTAQSLPQQQHVMSSTAPDASASQTKGEGHVAPASPRSDYMDVESEEERESGGAVLHDEHGMLVMEDVKSDEGDTADDDAETTDDDGDTFDASDNDVDSTDDGYLMDAINQEYLST